MTLSNRTHATEKIEQLFAAKAVARGGVVRRCRLWVDDQIGRDLFVEEVGRRGFGLLEVGGQYVVICSRRPIRRII